tara:strand:+ start:274 stop:669 length:396 start_codon:yes stop_codon:yes gene_type:complete
MSKVGELAIEIEKEEIAFNHSLHDIEHETIDTTWDIRVEGKLNKNNIIFKDKKYKELYLDMKKVDDKLKENKMNFKKVLIWLKVNDIAFVEYESKEDDQRYFDYRTSKYFTKEELLNMAKEKGYNNGTHSI